LCVLSSIFFCEGPQILKNEGGYGIAFLFGPMRGANPDGVLFQSKAKWTVIYDSPEILSFSFSLLSLAI
jgi:hypothetical protein